MGENRAIRRLAILISTLILGGSVLSACKTTGGTGDGGPSAGSTAGGGVVVHDFGASSKKLTGLFRSGPGNPTGPLPTGTGTGGGRVAQGFDGTPEVGALFFAIAGVVSTHYCTAAVVHSEAGNLLATAAHCVYDTLYGGYPSEIVFVPGYYDYTAPHGLWGVQKAYLTSSWISSENPDDDVAFLVVQSSAGGSGTLESDVGAYRFLASPGYRDSVDVVGYPLTGKYPVSCAVPTSEFSATQLTGGGGIAGVLGGYQQGGNSSSTSYSAYFGPTIENLYQSADAG